MLPKIHPDFLDEIEIRSNKWITDTAIKRSIGMEYNKAAWKQFFTGG